MTILSLRTLFVCTFFSLFSIQTQALTPHETWIHQGIPSEDLIAKWSSTPGTRNLNMQLGDPRAWDLQPLLKLRGNDRVRAEVTRYPGKDTAEAWHALAAQGVELVGLNGGLPTPYEISLLNRIGFKHVVFVLNGFPSEDHVLALKELKVDASITLLTSRYPNGVDLLGLLQVPANIPIQLVTQYWPRKAQVDYLNRLAGRLKLRITESFPTKNDFEYLLLLKNLDEVILVLRSGPSRKSEWEKFGAMRVRWSCKGEIPPVTALLSFEASARLGERLMVVDTDQGLIQDEWARLEKSSLPVEWIHTQ